jgi:beta-xylosidase
VQRHYLGSSSLATTLLLAALACDAEGETGGASSAGGSGGAPGGSSSSGAGTGGGSGGHGANGGAPCEAALEPAPPPHQNPLIDSGCADPGAIRFEQPGPDPCGPPTVEYFMACTGGSPDGGIYRMYRSSDMVAWEDAGAIFPSGSEPAWVDGQTWAPEIHQVGEKYVAYYSAQAGNTPDYFCLGAASADTPAGPFEDIGAPLLCDPVVSLIDASYLFDETTGRHWLYFKPNWNAQGQTTTIDVIELAADGLSLIGPRTELIENDLPWEGDIVEAPWVMRRDDFFYLFYSADFYNNGYKVGVARASAPDGPFEKLGQPILVADEAWIHPGHNSVVHAHGQAFMVYHAYQAADPGAGRRPMLDRIDWTYEGWPTINDGTPSNQEVDLLAR